MKKLITVITSLMFYVFIAVLYFYYEISLIESVLIAFVISVNAMFYALFKKLLDEEKGVTDGK